MARIRTTVVHMWRSHAPLTLFAAGNVVLAVFCLVAMLVDPRVLGGMPIWTKPFKFAMSFLLYTVMWMWLISRARRWTPTNRWAGTVVAVAGVGELVAIVLQVVRGRYSHFNIMTTFDSVVWWAMSGLIAALFLANLVWSILLWRAPNGEDRSITVAIRFGIAISLIGLALGGLMVAPRAEQLEAEENNLPTMSGAHAVGIPDGGPGIPVLGWSTEGGDLRIGHFVGMHALQLMPLAALALIAMSARIPLLRNAHARSQLVGVAGSAYAGLLALVTWQALRGQSIIAPDAWTVAVFSTIVVATLVGATAILARGTGVDLEPAAVPDRAVLPLRGADLPVGPPRLSVDTDPADRGARRRGRPRSRGPIGATGLTGRPA